MYQESKYAIVAKGSKKNASLYIFKKQPSKGVLIKRCSKNM